MFDNTLLVLFLVFFVSLVMLLGLAVGLVVRFFINRKGTRHV